LKAIDENLESSQQTLSLPIKLCEKCNKCPCSRLTAGTDLKRRLQVASEKSILRAQPLIFHGEKTGRGTRREEIISPSLRVSPEHRVPVCLRRGNPELGSLPKQPTGIYADSPNTVQLSTQKNECYRPHSCHSIIELSSSIQPSQKSPSVCLQMNQVSSGDLVLRIGANQRKDAVVSPSDHSVSQPQPGSQTEQSSSICHTLLNACQGAKTFKIDVAKITQYAKNAMPIENVLRHSLQDKRPVLKTHESLAKHKPNALSICQQSTDQNRLN